VTIVHVAAEARVSIASVSRVLAGSTRVDADLVKRIRAAVARLGYVPDRRARALVQGRSNSIGAIVPTVDNAIFARAIQSLQMRLDADGYRLLLATTEYDLEREMAGVQALVEHGVDGLVLVGSLHHPRVLPLLDSRPIPYVQTWTCDPASPVPTIGFDNRDAMGRLVLHLVDLGHRRIAMIAGVTAGNDRATARIAGLRDALAARGLVADAIVERAYTIPEGRAAARALLSRKPAPTALVCGNDILAFGALVEAAAMGISVPGALSVTGFDDLDLASHIVPPLTTIRVPSAAMGHLAAENLLARIAGRETSNAMVLDVELILRGTTAPPKRASAT
jgi:LacI family transcriptional regulator